MNATRTGPGTRSEMRPAAHAEAPTAKPGGNASPHKPARYPKKPVARHRHQFRDGAELYAQTDPQVSSRRRRPRSKKIAVTPIPPLCFAYFFILRASYCYNRFRGRSCFACSEKQTKTISGKPLEAIGMDDVYRMYAMSDGEGDAEPAEVDHDEDIDEEEEEVETSSVLTSSTTTRECPKRPGGLSESPLQSLPGMRPRRRQPRWRRKSTPRPAKQQPRRQRLLPRQPKKAVAKKSSGGTSQEGCNEKASQGNREKSQDGGKEEISQEAAKKAATKSAAKKVASQKAAKEGGKEVKGHIRRVWLTPNDNGDPSQVLREKQLAAADSQGQCKKPGSCRAFLRQGMVGFRGPPFAAVLGPRQGLLDVP